MASVLSVPMGIVLNTKSTSYLRKCVHLSLTVTPSERLHLTDYVNRIFRQNHLKVMEEGVVGVKIDESERDLDGLDPAGSLGVWPKNPSF